MRGKHEPLHDLLVVRGVRAYGGVDDAHLRGLTSDARRMRCMAVVSPASKKHGVGDHRREGCARAGAPERLATYAPCVSFGSYVGIGIFAE